MGKTSIEDSQHIIFADTLYSALCLEAVSENKLEQFLESDIRLSDAFPYKGNELYLPKPIVPISTLEQYAAKKAFKRLSYIPSYMLDDFLAGCFTPDDAEYYGDMRFGVSQIVSKLNVKDYDNSDSYEVGVYHFEKDAGLYIIATENSLLETLLQSLSYTGIGGKKNSGYGKFSLEKEDLPEEISTKISIEASRYMTLSTSLPKEDEIDKAIEEATYQLIKRSGFVYSNTYSDIASLRKKDLYVLSAGSIVQNKYEGDIYDVSHENGHHPIYRYAKGMFLGIGQ